MCYTLDVIGPYVLLSMYTTIIRANGREPKNRYSITYISHSVIHLNNRSPLAQLEVRAGITIVPDVERLGCVVVWGPRFPFAWNHGDPTVGGRAPRLGRRRRTTPVAPPDPRPFRAADESARRPGELQMLHRFLLCFNRVRNRCPFSYKILTVSGFQIWSMRIWMYTDVFICQIMLYVYRARNLNTLIVLIDIPHTIYIIIVIKCELCNIDFF